MGPARVAVRGDGEQAATEVSEPRAATSELTRDTPNLCGRATARRGGGLGAQNPDAPMPAGGAAKGRGRSPPALPLAGPLPGGPGNPVLTGSPLPSLLGDPGAQGHAPQAAVGRRWPLPTRLPAVGLAAHRRVVAPTGVLTRPQAQGEGQWLCTPQS